MQNFLLMGGNSPSVGCSRPSFLISIVRYVTPKLPSIDKSTQPSPLTPRFPRVSQPHMSLRRRANSTRHAPPDSSTPNGPIAPPTKPYPFLQNAGYVSAAIFAFALLIRVIYLLEMRDSVLFSVLLGDSAGYDRWAREIATGQWFGTEVFYQAPLYPYFLATIYALFGPSTWSVRIVQAIVGSCAAALLAHAGRKWFGPVPGLIAGLMLACYPPAIFFDGLLQKSVLDSLWISALLAALPTFDQRKSIPRAMLIGAILAFFALTRENALALIPVLLFWIATRPDTHRTQRLQFAGALTLGILLILLPVGIRNAAIGGRLLLTTSQFGPNFYIGNNPQADGFYQPLRKWRAEVKFEQRDARELAEAAAGRSLTPAEVSRYWSNRAFDFLREQPLAWLRLTWRKWLMTWNASENMDTEALEVYRDESWLLYLTAPLLHFGFLAPLAAIGVALSIRQWRTLWPLYAITAILALTVALFFVFARYRFPIVHPLMLFAGYALFELWQSVRTGAYRPLWLPAATGLLIALFVNLPNFAQMHPRALTLANVAGALVDQERYADANTWFDRAFSLARDLPELQYAYAESLTKQDRHLEAAEYLRKVIAAHPDLFDARYLLVDALASAGQLELAATHCPDTLRLSVFDPAAYFRCAAIYESLHRFDDAVQTYRSLLDKKNDLPSAWYNLGNLFARRADTTAAIDCYQQVLKLDPQNAGALNNWGLLLAQQGNLNEATERFQSALRINPDFADAHNNLGKMWQLRGDKTQARLSFTRALEINPEHVLARQNLTALDTP